MDNLLAPAATLGPRKDGSPPPIDGLPHVRLGLEPYGSSPCKRAQDADLHRSPAPGKASSGYRPERRSTALPRPRATRPVGASPGAVGHGVTADLGPPTEQVLSDGEERQTHAAPPPGNGGRVPRSGSASGSALNEGTNVRLRSRKRDEDGGWIEADELGMVIGFEGELVVVSFTESRTATLEASDLLVVPPRTGR